MSRTLSVVALLLLLSGCGGGSGAGPEAQTPVSAAPAATLQDIPWAERNGEQRAKYMAKVVVPKMRQVFQGFSPEMFAEVNCATCHGKNFKQVHFKMPNGLHPLSATDPIGSAMAENEQTAKFMTETVVPTMSELLGMTPVGPDNPTGFGCFNCHEKQD